MSSANDPTSPATPVVPDWPSPSVQVAALQEEAYNPPQPVLDIGDNFWD
jgi:hypothetical protein